MISKEEIKNIIKTLIDGDTKEEINAIKISSLDYASNFKKAHIIVCLNEPSDYVADFMGGYEDSDIYIMTEFSNPVDDDIILYSRNGNLAPDKRREAICS